MSLPEIMAESKNASMCPGSQSGPEQAVESSFSSANQCVRDEQQEEYGDAVETMEDRCTTPEDSSGSISQVGCLGQLILGMTCSVALDTVSDHAAAPQLLL